MFRLITALLISLAAYPPDANAQPVRDRNMRFDVVELIGGEQVEGTAEFTATFGKFTYWFTNEANHAAFLDAPERFEIQLGGTCARMGPLSGEGTPRLPAAHNDRVYIFASEACRSRFLESPAAFSATADPAPDTTEESRKLGRRMLGKAVDAIACHAMIDGVTTYREVLARDEKSGETTYRITSTTTLRRPGSVCWKVCWNEMCWSYRADPQAGWMIDSDGESELVPQQRAELLREHGRHPYAILWARDSGEIVLHATGETRTITVPDEGEMQVELVTAHLHGATSTLGLDESGKIRLLAYIGRGPNATLGAVNKIYSSYHIVDGLRVPGRVDTFFDGEAVAKESGVFVDQAFDDPADATTFDRDDLPPPLAEGASS